VDVNDFKNLSVLSEINFILIAFSATQTTGRKKVRLVGPNINDLLFGKLSFELGNEIFLVLEEFRGDDYKCKSWKRQDLENG